MNATMNYAKAGIFFFICWLVQTALLWRIWPFGAAPNLLLCAAVCFAWLYDKNYALVFSIIFGIFLDISTQRLFGAETLTLVLCMIPAFLLRRVFNPERLLPVLAASLFATPIGALGLWAVYRLCGSPIGIALALIELPELFISQAAICALLHIAFVRTIIKHRKDRRYVGGVV